MKRKILIFALCCSLLLGVFSISAFAEETYDITSCSYHLPMKVWSSTTGYGKYNISGSITYTTVAGNPPATLEFKAFNIGYQQNGSAMKQYIQIICTDNTKTQFYADTCDMYVTFYENTSDISLYEYLKGFEYYPPHEHLYTSSLISPTHIEKGYTLYTCYCGDTYTDNEVSALGHTYQTTITEPTCTESGGTKYYCDCGYFYYGNEVAPLGHTYQTTITEPTCVDNGYTLYSCSCGYSYKEDISALGHTYQTTITEPTCTESGVTKYYCDCGYYYYGNEVAPLGHNIVGKYCSVCNVINPDLVVKSKDFIPVFSGVKDQVNVSSVVSVLCVVVLSCVGLVFIWFIVRKVTSSLMKAFRKGKISL